MMGEMIRVRVARRRKPAKPAAWLPIGTDVVERDDGMFQVGIDDDAAGPFPSSTFAAAVAAQTRAPHADRVLDADLASKSVGLPDDPRPDAAGEYETFGDDERLAREHAEYFYEGYWEDAGYRR
jgi:hypothetical protein